MEVFTVISNASLLLASYTAWKFGRIFRAPTLFAEAIISALYHLCIYSTHCLFGYQALHYLDFFNAELQLVLVILYFIDFKDGYRWIEWLMILFFVGVLVVLQIVFSSELYVQAGLIGFLVIILIGYWCIFGIPKYDWYYVTLSLSLLAISAILFSYQTVYPEGYWAIHSMWHLTAGVGITFSYYIKDPVLISYNAANKI